MVTPSFRARHVSGRNDADQVSTRSEHDEEVSSTIGLAQDEISILILGMALVEINEKGPAEKDLLALFPGHPVLLPVLGVVASIPIEAREPREVDQRASEGKIGRIY
jgi:hypothetical protein